MGVWRYPSWLHACDLKTNNLLLCGHALMHHNILHPLSRRYYSDYYKLVQRLSLGILCRFDPRCPFDKNTSSSLKVAMSELFPRFAINRVTIVEDGWSIRMKKKLQLSFLIFMDSKVYSFVNLFRLFRGCLWKKKLGVSSSSVSPIQTCLYCKTWPLAWKIMMA